MSRILRAIDAHALASPEAVALSTPSATWTYAQLGEAVSRTATALFAFAPPARRAARWPIEGARRRPPRSWRPRIKRRTARPMISSSASHAASRRPSVARAGALATVLIVAPFLLGVAVQASGGSRGLTQPSPPRSRAFASLGCWWSGSGVWRSSPEAIGARRQTPGPSRSGSGPAAAARCRTGTGSCRRRSGRWLGRSRTRCPPRRPNGMCPVPQARRPRRGR